MIRLRKQSNSLLIMDMVLINHLNLLKLNYVTPLKKKYIKFKQIIGILQNQI